MQTALVIGCIYYVHVLVVLIRQTLLILSLLHEWMDVYMYWSDLYKLSLKLNGLSSWTRLIEVETVI